MPGPDLDAWLPEPQVLSRHRRTSTAEPAELWRAAREIRLNETRTLGRLDRLQLRALWLIVGRFERVIAAEPLPLAVARAEGRRDVPEGVTPAPRRRGR